MCSFGILSAIILYLYYMGWMYESEGFMTLAYMAVVLFVLAFLFLIYRRYTVKGNIEVPINISEEGKNTLVKVIVTNKSFLPISRMKAVIMVTDTLLNKKKKYVLKLPTVPKGRHCFESNLVFPRSSNYEIMLKQFVIYDLTGLFYRRRRVRKWQSVQVMPKFYDVPVMLTESTRHFSGEADVYEDGRVGQDKNEILQVREYKAGDRLQNIHWKMSAKQDELMVKENSMPKSCPVVLFLDFKGIKKLRKNMIAFVETVASISFSLMDVGCMHYVAWYSPADMDVVRVRIDNEGSLYFLIEHIMKNKWVKPKENIVERYNKKFLMEPYIWKLQLDEELVLKKQGQVIAKYSAKDLEKEISSIEILL